MKLRYRLVLLPILAVTPVVILLAWNQRDLRDSRFNEIEQQVLGLAKQQASEVDRIAEGALQFLVALAQIPDIKDGTAECGPLLTKIRTNYQSYVALIRADLKGVVTCSSIGPGPSIEDRLYFRKAVASNNFSVGEFALGRGTKGAASIHFSYPLRNERLEVTGVIAAALDLKWFAERLKEKLTSNIVLNVADINGTILVRHPNNEKFSGQKIPDQFHPIIKSPAPGVAEVIGLDGEKQVLGYVPIPTSTYGFHVGVARNLEAAFVDIDRAQHWSMMLVLVGLVGSLALVALWGEFSIRRPVAELVSNVHRWRAGDYAPSDRQWESSEFSDVGRAFNELVAAVSEREERLVASEKRLQDHQRYLTKVLDQVPAGIMQTKPDKTYGFVNKAFAELLGRSKEELIGHKFTEFTYSEDCDHDSKLFEQALRERKSYMHRKRYVRPDGSVVMSENTITHLENDEGILAVCVDLAERLRTEAMQKRLIDELNHRVRNTLATVQALFSTSSRYTKSPDELVQNFVARIGALSATHNLLTETLWEGASLLDLVNAELQPYAQGRTIEVKGPHVNLTPFQTIALGMVIHELATNAAKYGGLSFSEGSISVSWQISPDKQLTIRWQEFGCVGVAEPERRGFGSRLIQQSVSDLGGTVTKEFRDTGLVCIVVVPIA